MGVKPIPSIGNVPIHQDPPLYRGRYDPPAFEVVPPGVDPPIPGYEPSPFEKPTFGPAIDRDRLPPGNHRDSFRPFPEGPGGYRNLPLPPGQREIPVHVGDHTVHYRENFRGGPPFRDQGNGIPYRDGQPFRDSSAQPPPFRDPGYRPPSASVYRDNAYRNNSHSSFRDGPSGKYRDNIPYRDGSTFKPPNIDQREAPGPINYNDPNFREAFREGSQDGNIPRDHMRGGYRPNNRNRPGSRRPPHSEHDKYRERDFRDRERYNENRDPVERSRDLEKKVVFERHREDRSRDERGREYDRVKEYNEKDRDYDRTSSEKKIKSSPKRSRPHESRDKKRSESRGRSRDRDGRRDKKEERSRDKTSTEGSRDHKEKDKKIKDRKKKKKEKEDRKKKREKKERKEKDVIKKESEDVVNKDVVTDNIENIEASKEKAENEVEKVKASLSPKIVKNEKPDELYSDVATDGIDKNIIENYVKHDEQNQDTDQVALNKDECFDGIELQVPSDELDLKLDNDNNDKEMLASLPALSKWEVDEDAGEKIKEPGEISSPEAEENNDKVTSEVIKRAENAIFTKAINSLRPIEIKKISGDRIKLYADDSTGMTKGLMNNIQITVPIVEPEQRSVELNERKKRSSKTPPRLSVKDRLGGKIEDVRRSKDTRVVQSTVERVKSRSKTPKRDQPYRRVTVDRDRGQRFQAKVDSNIQKVDIVKSERRISSEAVKSERTDQFDKYRKDEKYSSTRTKDDNKKKELLHKHHKEAKKTKLPVESEKSTNANNNTLDKNGSESKNSSLNRERKKSTLDEANFEPDYDETVESDNETKQETGKKRERSKSPIFEPVKKIKTEIDTIKLDLANVKKKDESGSESTSGSESSSSSSSSEARKRKRKKKRTKRKKRHAVSDSESDSDSSSDDHKKKKKRRKHKKKSSKKKKKSKHK